MFHPSEDWLPALPKQNQETHVEIIEINMSRINESYAADQDDHECMTKF